CKTRDDQTRPDRGNATAGPDNPLRAPNQRGAQRGPDRTQGSQGRGGPAAREHRTLSGTSRERAAPRTGVQRAVAGLREHSRALRISVEALRRSPTLRELGATSE